MVRFLKHLGGGLILNFLDIVALQEFLAICRSSRGHFYTFGAYRAYLERHEPGENLHRFYAMQVSRVMFGFWVLTRRWGKTGAHTVTSIIASYDSEAEATEELETECRAKRKLGYLTLIPQIF